MWSREISKILRNKENIYGFSYTIVRGSVGTVSKYVNLRTMENVAIKIIRKKSDQRKEIKMTEALRELDPDETNIVRFIEHFKWEKCACLVFELLDQSLYDLLLSRGLCPLTLEEIRPVAHQVLTALDALHTIGVVHNDLKLDNIMLVKNKTPYKVKIIDFGMAFKTSEAERYQGVEMQMLRLRAPEIILGHPVSEAVDLWSFGCILVQLLFRGPYPFQGNNEFDMLKHIVHVVGQPSDRVLDASQHANKFFVKSGHWDNPKWSLKRTNEYEEKESRMERRPRIINRLHDLLDFREVGENMDDARAFVNLLKCLLQTDPEQRITAGRALSHSFVTMKHLMKESPTYSGDSLNQRLAGEKETMTQLYPSPLSTPVTSGQSNETGSSFESTFSASSCATDEGPSAKSSDSCPTFIVDKTSAASTTESISRPLSLESSAGAPEAPSSYVIPKDTPSSYIIPKDTPSSYIIPKDTPSSSGSPKDTPSSYVTPKDTPSSYVTPKDTPSSSGSPKDTPSSSGSPKDTPSSYVTPKDTPSSYVTPKDTPSSSGAPKAALSAAGAPEATPSSSGTPKDTPSSSGTPKDTPSSSGSPKDTPSSSGTPKDTPSSSGSPKDTPSSSGTPKDTPSSSGSPKDTPSSAVKSDDMPSCAGAPEATPSSAGAPEATPSSPGTPKATPSSSDTPKDPPTSVGSSKDTPSTGGSPEKKPSAAGAIEKTPSVADAPVVTLSTAGAPAEWSPVKPKKTCLQRICIFLAKDKNYLKRSNKVYAECMQVGP